MINFDNSGTSSPAITFDEWGSDEATILGDYLYSKSAHETPEKAAAEDIASGRINKADVVPQYPSDVISFESPDMLKFITPAFSDGLGTWIRWQFHKSDLPIYGLLHVDSGGDPGAELYKIRLPGNLSRLRAVLLDNFRENFQNTAGP